VNYNYGKLMEIKDMNKIKDETKELKIEALVSFSMCPFQTYEDARLEQLMDSIERLGLMTPIIVRPVDNGKYEIICGHNRTKAMKALGYIVIRANVRYGLTDEEALKLFYESNLNQQSFSDWSYSQKIEAVKYCDKIIKETSQQGKRTDLEKEHIANSGNETCVQGRQKLERNIAKRSTSRDKMARRLGISTATLSKFRRIIKLPDDLISSLAQLLDEKKITFEAAYRISNMREVDIKLLMEGITKYPDRKLDLKKLKELPTKKADKDSDKMYPISKERVWEVLIPPDSSDLISPYIRKKSDD
jgi:Predicted transcriptional regulators